MKKARLTFDLSLCDQDELPEDMLEQVPEGCEKRGILILIGYEEEDSEISVEDLKTRDPLKYAGFSALAAFAECLLSGLQHPRGTSIEEATELSQDKIREARECAMRAVFTDALEKIAFEKCPTEGEC